MKSLGFQISEDGKTEWRSNGDRTQRYAFYTGNPRWENVTKSPITPTTPAELKAFCEAGNFGYEPPKN